MFDQATFATRPRALEKMDHQDPEANSTPQAAASGRAVPPMQ